MIYLILIAAVFCCFFYQSLTLRKDGRIYWFCAALTLFILIFRSFEPTLVNYQDDVPNYIGFYNNLQSSNYGTPDNPTFGFEPGLSVFCRALWLFPKSDLLFVLMMRLVCMAPVLYGIYRYSSQKELSLLFVILLPGCWLLEMIAMRQALATSFLLWAVLIHQSGPRHWKIWIAVFLVMAVLCHSTSILVILIAAVAILIPFRKSVCYIALGVSAITGGIFASRIASVFSSVISPLQAMERVTSYISEGTEIGSMNPISFLVLALLGVICVFATEKGDKKKEFFVKLLVSGIVIYCLLGNYPLVDRMTSFFMLAGAMGAMPSLPSAGKSYISLNWWMSIAVCLACIYLFYSDNCRETSVFLPYHFLCDRPLLWMYR